VNLTANYIVNFGNLHRAAGYLSLLQWPNPTENPKLSKLPLMKQTDASFGLWLPAFGVVRRRGLATTEITG